ncbi:hypothetical protein Desti_3020 [Desulfomonile tiedjei DSM 6799]|uniref:Uncharacterized protein n=1 Tax=Desulfomonile tiedjei (strain ATCC 49306 / DSM 6799 / DCB-1) TaxID=706587 RepID=I4C7Z3_DESTA|nr:hypothetical protein Desti_3020 [Desulfomonile tiedjei DSM 6799]
MHTDSNTGNPIFFWFFGSLIGNIERSLFGRSRQISFATNGTPLLRFGDMPGPDLLPPVGGITSLNAHSYQSHAKSFISSMTYRWVFLLFSKKL